MKSVLTAILALTCAGCAPPSTSLENLSKATMLAADLRVQFIKAGDAANRAVMADTDDTSVAFAREAQEAAQAAQKDSADLRPQLMQLGYTQEKELLDQFDRQFADYRTLDAEVLGLAVENTNLKAQRLSFGAVHDAAAAFAMAITDAASAAPNADRGRAQSLAASAIAAAREIEVLEAPHIAESDDAAMTRMEASMASAAKDAGAAVTMLSMLLPAASRPKAQAAAAALDHFTDLNTQVVMLSRRNSNVKSLALSLGRKRMLTATCDDTLRALQDALAKRGFSATR